MAGVVQLLALPILPVVAGVVQLLALPILLVVVAGVVQLLALPILLVVAAAPRHYRWAEAPYYFADSIHPLLPVVAPAVANLLHR
ncbi:MAG: hypothetical protein NVSMB33_03410 [Ktedonobacteraceae bacterium]